MRSLIQSSTIWLKEKMQVGRRAIPEAEAIEIQPSSVVKSSPGDSSAPVQETTVSMPSSIMPREEAPIESISEALASIVESDLLLDSEIVDPLEETTEPELPSLATPDTAPSIATPVPVQEGPPASLTLVKRGANYYATCPHCQSSWNVRERFYDLRTRQFQASMQMECPGCKQALMMPPQTDLRKFM